MAVPEQVLFDTETENLLYILPSPDKRKIKLVLSLNYRTKGKVVNSARTAFKLLSDAIAGGIKGDRYKVVR
ncbi:hypothetical protein [Nitrosospira sp. Nsp1]|uniref:hypothetical protein n=1 Tax=Nitrosospira sp. Nsp1 TaxID=136547 RepID=UPI0008891B5E|nr:hypothetical protein [Nitrosospira sp. Nsp1]SCX57814.1 hypothetical protein SAMN05720354_12036 [Nitrosospira sp. Nsp1]